MNSQMPKSQSQSKLDGFGPRRAQRHAARRHRLDRRQHHRSHQARARALSRRGGDRKQERGRLGGAGARAACPLRGGRRSRRLWGAQGRARRDRNRGRGRPGRLDRGGAAAGRMGDRCDHRRRRAQADAGGGRARRDGGDRQQGMPGLRRRPVHAPRGGRRRDRAAGRFRAQCVVPGHERRPAPGRAARDPDRLRGAVSHQDRSRDQGGDAGAGPAASQLVDGTQGHDRFRDLDEQGPRGHRGLSSVRAQARRDRCAGPSAIDHPRPGRVPRRLADRPARQPRHAHPDRALPGLAG